MTVLFTNPLGFTFERTDYKNRSKVKVSNRGYNLRTYRFNNVECFESPYISWQNLDQCNGWATDESYLYTAVQNGTKLFAGIVHLEGQSFECSDDVVVITKKHRWLEGYCETHICRKGTLSDYYDLAAVVAHYERLGITPYLDETPNLIGWFLSVDISVFATDEAPFEYWNAKTLEELIFTGLLLGYPLESTASIIEEWGLC